MSTPLNPRISEFETQEQVDSYDRWFRERVQRSLNGPRPNIPHDEAMAKLRSLLLESKKRQHTAG
ncbi:MULTISPECIES: antitoxin [Modicisalibacter]|uniref:type II toxin-antitoxin system RelB family antitoxin n=1 Tax=Modicisalibacter TaxID=574347 RepID=UPI00100BCFB3|nr:MULTISPECIES: antitoxin [Halomonadaceae]MBZ9559511.1 stability determinant [Modicisalibacter sp. R2A 31.J]MBZ9576963.1 stability determinant [Modicisalibacter sp. MOD 31.J]